VSENKVLTSRDRVETNSQPTALHNSEWPTIPQVYIKGEFVGGCDIMLSSSSP
jgi:glutaredoxin-related protein